MTDPARLVQRYRDFARATAGQSACFTEWASGVAGDLEVLAWISTFPHSKQQPNLVFAAARWHGVVAPGPYAGLRQALLGDDGPIRETIMSRATQTNEVGRLATLMPVFAQLAARSPGRPLSLLEVGPSAGLCLYPDRYGYAWPPLGRLTAPGGGSDGPSGPVLRCAVSGPMPVPQTPLIVARRSGIDLHPLDVQDADAMAWLEILVWPEQDERRARLRAAIEIARREPPELITGDLLEQLPAEVDRAAQWGRVVVFHSAVIGYLDPAARQAFQAMMTGLLADRRCHWVSNEDPRVLPELTATAGPPLSEPYFLLGLDGRAVGWSHQHGASLIWL